MLDAISSLLKQAERQLDDIAWEDPEDPRIEDLVRQIADYKSKLERGELYEPRF